MYALLSGCLPFFGSSPMEVFDRIKKAEVNFEYKEFRNISQSAKDLISKLLTKNKKERYTCLDALQHPWFKEAASNANPAMKMSLDPFILDRLKTYKGVSTLKKEAMNVLVKMLDPRKIEDLQAVFHDMDKDQTGMITT